MGPDPLAADAAPGGPRASQGRARLEEALAGLTPAQRVAVESPVGPLCIVAGAGSGKTRVLTLRVAHRVADDPGEADHTVVCTFTRKAADELRGRLRGYGLPVAAPVTTGPPAVGGSGSVDAPPGGVRAGTLHQLALSLVRRHAQDAGRTPPAVVDQRSRILAGVTTDRSALPALEQEIAWAKARCLDPTTYPEAAVGAGRRPGVPFEVVATTFAAYQETLTRRRVVDLDDILLVAADRLEEDPGFAEAVRWRYRHLSVDEFQDVNPAQFRLVGALAGERWDVCVVGDPNQAVYGWNGADPTLLGRLPDLIPDMTVVELPDNHRSTPEVVRAAAAALGPGAPLLPRSVAASGPLSVVTTYDDEDEEARGVADVLAAEHAAGIPWSELAVLARTHDQLATVRRALSRAGVPVVVAPGPEAGGDRSGRPRNRPGDPDGSGSDGAVELATFHRAKGLEWRSVCVVGLEDGYVPIVHAASPAAVAEERRLLYVALTRASDRLWCSWARSRRSGGSRRAVPREPSPWLAAVARCSRTGADRPGPTPAGDAVAHIARLRARLRT